MAFVYILSEDDNDDFFYKSCLEKITGKSFKQIFRKLRKGGGINEVRKKYTILLKEIEYTGNVEDTFFIIALDNDRSPEHPEHNRLQGLSNSDNKKKCRFCEVKNKITEILGKETEDWPIKGAIAVPVQMLESWLLLVCNSEKYKDEKSLPIFSLKNQSSAKDYYKSNKIPDQLKDLCEKKKRQLNIDSNQEFIQHCCEHLIPDKLSEVSTSFNLFKNQIDSFG